MQQFRSKFRDKNSFKWGFTQKQTDGHKIVNQRIHKRIKKIASVVYINSTTIIVVKNTSS